MDRIDRADAEITAQDTPEPIRRMLEWATNPWSPA